MTTEIAACVILYNPKKEDVKNISTYANKVDKLYIFDNTETNSNSDYFKNYNNIEYIWDGENKGLAIRLNQACKQAIADGYSFLLTMDQDSSFLENSLEQYYFNIKHFKNKETVATYGLEYNSKAIENCESDFSEEEHLITSASILNLNLYPEIGGFDENLFIDGVDIDYCYAALTKGYKNIKFGKIYFNHTLGEPSRVSTIYTLHLFKKNKTIHSTIRIYYMYRNILYLEKKYQNILPDVIRVAVHSYMHHIKKCIKYSPEFFTVLKYKRKAIKDFKNNQMGKIKL